MQLGTTSESNFAPWDPPRTNNVLGHGPGSKYWELEFFKNFFSYWVTSIQAIFGI